MFVGGIFLSEKIILKEKKKERERERIPDRQIPFLSLSHSLCRGRGLCSRGKEADIRRKNLYQKLGPEISIEF